MAELTEERVREIVREEINNELARRNAEQVRWELDLRKRLGLDKEG